MRKFILTHQRNAERLILFLCLFLLTACALFIQSVQQSIWQNASRNLQTITYKNAQFVYNRLKYMQDDLQTLSQIPPAGEAERQKLLDRFSRRHKLGKISILPTAQHPYADRFAPHASVSRPYAGVAGEISILAQAPLSETQTIFAESPLYNFFENYALEFYGPKAAAGLIDTEGNFLLPPRNASSTYVMRNVSELFRDGQNDGVFSEMQLGLQNHRAGIFTISRDGKDSVLSYAPVGDSGWYMLLMLPRSTLQKEENHIILYALSVSALILLCTVFISWFFYRNMRAYNSKLLELAYRDPVTGANNFLKFKLDMQQLLQQHPAANYAVIYSDIRNFKYINDVYGFAVGDKILCHYVRCMQESKKKETYGRVSGDTFLSLIRYQDAREIAEHCRSMSQSLSDISAIIPDAASLHIYMGVYCTDGDNASISIEKMIDRANLAHQQAKNHAIAPCVVYTDELRQAMIAEQALENRMESALSDGEFEVYLQPKYNLHNDAVTAAEALVRWNHPEEGLISPARFIPLFERNGFIRKLDAYMFESVCKLLQRWMQENRALLPISVNISRAQLHSNQFLSEYVRLKNAYDIPDRCIEIEFTESLAFGDIDRIQKVLQHFHAHGFSCSIDDFGAGYSSLNLLKDLPVDVLKLDKLFFDKSTDPEREQIIIESVVSMAKRLHMCTVAEGVEALEQVEFLRKIGCDLIQGYVFDRPLPVSVFEQKYIRTK